jgi:hypothetical protein
MYHWNDHGLNRYRKQAGAELCGTQFKLGAQLALLSHSPAHNLFNPAPIACATQCKESKYRKMSPLAVYPPYSMSPLQYVPPYSMSPLTVYPPLEYAPPYSMFPLTVCSPLQYVPPYSMFPLTVCMSPIQYVPLTVCPPLQYVPLVLFFSQSVCVLTFCHSPTPIQPNSTQHEVGVTRLLVCNPSPHPTQNKLLDHFQTT